MYSPLENGVLHIKFCREIGKYVPSLNRTYESGKSIQYRFKFHIYHYDLVASYRIRYLSIVSGNIQRQAITQFNDYIQLGQKEQIPMKF